MPMVDQKGGNLGKGAQPKGKQKETDRPGKAKIPCRSHAAGECRFGSRCRFADIGEPGSAEAKKEVEDHKPKECKGDKKGDGKGTGRKDRGKAGASATVPSAATAAPASTVTITKVEAMWKSLIEFAKKALPAMKHVSEAECADLRVVSLRGHASRTPCRVCQDPSSSKRLPRHVN